MKKVWDLFLQFLLIGAFSIGGGYAIIPIIEGQVVDNKAWLTLQELTDIITISQMTPGPLVVNLSTFVGIRHGGIEGAAAAKIGAVLIGSISSILLYRFFKQHNELTMVNYILNGLRAVSIGLIAASALSILSSAFFNYLPIAFPNVDLKAITIFILAFFLLRKFKMNPIYITIICGIIGFIVY